MKNTTRRTALKGLLGSSFAATTLRFLVRTAESASFPQRLLFVYTNAGRDSDSRSSGMGTSYSLGKGLAPLQPLQKKITILDGVGIPEHTGEEHPCGKSALLTGRAAAANSHMATGISFDRYLANKLANGVSFYAGTTTHQTNAGDIDLPVSWNAAGTVNEGYAAGSAALVRKLFSGAATPPPSAPGAMRPPASARDENEAALFDYLIGDVRRLQRFAPRPQIEKLELHVLALQQLRAALPTGGALVLDPPLATSASCGAAPDLSAAANETDRLSLVAAHALACGRARIGVLRIGDEDPYHNYSHWHDKPVEYRPQMRALDLQSATHFARLLHYLDAFPEGTGTLLDNTLVVWCSECCGEFGVGVQYGTANNSGENGIHGTNNMPLVLAGGLGGKVKTGQRIVAPDRTNVDLFRTIAEQMGSRADDFGAANLFHGGIPQLLA